MFLIFFGLSTIAGFLFLPSKISEGEVKKDSSNVPTVFDHIFLKYGKQYSLDWKMLKRIAWIESTLGKNSRVAIGLRTPANVKDSISFDGLSWGLMQMTLTTARDYDKLATSEKLNDPDYSIRLSAMHFSFLKRNYPTFSERDLVMAYNHGQGNQLRFIQKEKTGTLLITEFSDGRTYWKKYLSAKELIK